MIRIANESDLKTIKTFVSRDFIRNYFVVLSLTKDFDDYKEIYIEDNKGMLFLRKSGNLQFVQYGEANINAFKSLIKELEFLYLIGSQSMCHLLGLDIDHKGALISSLKKENYLVLPLSDEVQPLLVSDLNDVVTLYDQVFSGYPKLSYMTEKLKAKRGIGYTIKKDGVVSVAQSDFGSLITGVATHPNYQQKGYAIKCMVSLITSMFLSHDEIYLQYNNPNAGKLYEQLGFITIDQVIHYKKR